MSMYAVLNVNVCPVCSDELAKVFFFVFFFTDAWVVEMDLISLRRLLGSE